MRIDFAPPLANPDVSIRRQNPFGPVYPENSIRPARACIRNVPKSYSLLHLEPNRRESFDHLIVLGDGQLRRVLKEYVGYYNNCRAHLSLDGNAPVHRTVEPPSNGRVIAILKVGGLHHYYTRAA
jgi:hypothetical protein